MEKRPAVLFLLLFILPTAAGCVWRTSVPSSLIKTATSAISRAEKAGARETATLDLQMAREKVQQAEQAVQRHDYPEAQRLAEEAIADANVAEIKAKTAPARKEADEINENMQTLREKTGPTQNR